MTLGELLRQRRLQLAMTLEEVSKKAGCGKGYLCDIEHDVHDPGFRLVVRLSKTLRLSVNAMARAIEGEG